PVKISIEGLGDSRGVLIRFLSPRTVDAIVRLLPIEGRAALWQSEVYFEVPLKLGLEKPKEVAKRGDLAYWPLGRAFCIFLNDMRPHSPVNLIGQVEENIEVFDGIRSGMKIRVDRIDLK
ncbi:MAG: cyclophilin-like fold protein, partial [Candidatus Bathyarchaeia archaeon]